MNHHHESDLVSFSFYELWRPDIFLIIVLIGILYLLLVNKWRTHFVDADEVSSGKQMLFLFGLTTMYFGLGSPLVAYGHHLLFSAHMGGMALVYLVAPPMLLVGTPTWFVRYLVKRWQWLFNFLKGLTHPMISIIMFNFLFSMYHMPVIFDTVMAYHTLHLVFHTILAIGAFLMWWPVFSPLPELESLTPLKKIAYIFISGILLTPVCALIIFANQPIYETYMGAPQLFQILPTLDDQQLGGVIMKATQEITYIFVIATIFYSWARRERRNEDQGIV
jgi:putative membrane protein